MAALSTPASVKTSRRTPIGMPAMPPSEERPQPGELDVVPLRPDRGRMQQHAAAGDHQRAMHRIDAVQPDRGRGDPEGKAAAAGGDAAEQRADPENREGVVGQAGDHRVSRR